MQKSKFRSDRGFIIIRSGYSIGIGSEMSVCVCVLVCVCVWGGGGGVQITAKHWTHARDVPPPPPSL